MRKVMMAIDLVRGRKFIKSNKSRRYQAYCAIAHAHEFRKRTELPSFVIEKVRAALPEKEEKYSTNKPKI